jgi:hypothetical protein
MDLLKLGSLSSYMEWTSVVDANLKIMPSVEDCTRCQVVVKMWSIIMKGILGEA